MSTHADVKSCHINLFDAIKFPLFIQRILCISPFVRNGKHLVSSQITTAYSLCVIVGYILAIVFSVLQIHSNGFGWLDLSQGYLWIIIVCFELIIAVVSFPVVILFCLLSKHLQIELLTEIVRIDDVLIKEFGVDFNPIYLQFVHRQRGEMLICSIYFVYIYYTLHLVMQNHGLTLLGYYTFALAYILEQYVCALLFWSLSNSALLLRSKFVILNQIQEILYRNPYDKNNAKVTKRKLSNLMVTFKDVCMIIDFISKSVGSMFVLQMAHDFTLLTSQCYIIFYILTKKNNGDMAIFVVANLLVWMMQNVMRIGLTAIAMSRTVDEVEVNRGKLDTNYCK